MNHDLNYSCLNIGFTGTQKGMTAIQKEIVAEQIDYYQPNIVRHGDCIGADAEFHEIVVNKWIGHDPIIKIIIHPPSNRTKRALCKGDVILQPKDYLDRNHDIVDMSDFLIATPSGKEYMRSGTWATVRYARKKNKKIMIIYPDGRIDLE